MIKTTLKIKGMACNMCEAHMNEAIRNHFAVDKVTSSHAKGETVVISKEELDRAAREKVIAETGYTLEGAESEPYVKKGLFGFGK